MDGVHFNQDFLFCVEFRFLLNLSKVKIFFQLFIFGKDKKIRNRIVNFGNFPLFIMQLDWWKTVGKIMKNDNH